MRALLLILLVTLTATIAQAGGSVQARLIRASNTTSQPDPKLKDVCDKLQKGFGYSHYALIGEQSQKYEAQATRKLSPGEGFTVFVTPKSVKDKIHDLDIELYAGKVSVTKLSAKVGDGKSVFIKGPAVGATLIVIVVTAHN